MDIRTLCCIGSLLLVVNPALSADIKRWVDESGQVHFGDHAPQDTGATQVEPRIITTAPSSNNSLTDTMRPGELRMIKDYDKRGVRLIKAKKKELRKAKLTDKHSANSKKKCAYYQDKIDSLQRKLRAGCTRSEKNKIEERIAKHNLKVDEYCN